MACREISRSSRDFFGAALMAVVSLAFLAYEWDFRRHRMAGEAIVAEGSRAFGRSGLMIADGVHRVRGVPVRTSLRTFFHRIHPGQRVAVLYRPDNPRDAVPDLFWQRHSGSAIALVFFAFFAASRATTVRNGGGRRPGPLLGDGSVGDAEMTAFIG